ncbi:CENP-B homolog protein 2-like protein [Tanacetum coccineum]
MTDEDSKSIMQHNKDNKVFTQKQLQECGYSNLGLQVESSGTISKYRVKRSLEVLSLAPKEAMLSDTNGKKFPDLEKFSMNGFFNSRKCEYDRGLFFRLQPDHSLATMQLEGKKQDKERLTVAICCNEDGSEKLPLWIIGKYAKPRCSRYALSVVDFIEVFGGYELGSTNPAKINVLDAMNLAISAWTMDVSANTIANCFRHCKLRSTDNMTFENSDEGGESTQELQN